MANTHLVLQGVKDYTLELLGTEFRDDARSSATRSDAAANWAESARDEAVSAATHAASAAEKAGGHEDEARVQAEASAGHADRSDGHAGVSQEWAEQSKDAATLAITAAATVTQYVGEGFPEGKVSAPVGSIYTDRLATAGAVRWIKTTGDGNTGWKVEYGDTGWRDIRSSLVRTESISAGGTAQINRANSRVTLTMYDLSIIDSGTVRITDTLPVGFRPIYRDGFNISLSSDTAREGVVMSTGLYLYSVPSSSIMRLRTTLSWATSDPWPSTLAGTPS